MTKSSLEQLGVKAGDRIIVKGKIAFSEIATRVEGKRLEDKVKRQKARGFMYPDDKPHYAISIVDVDILPEYKGTPLATYYGERTYPNKEGKYALSLTSTSPFPPRIFHNREDGKAVRIQELPAEFAVGQEVQVLIDAYQPKNFARLGSSFSALLLPAGDISYYTDTAASEIEAFGLELVGEEKPEAVVSNEDISDNPFGGGISEPETTPEPEGETEATINNVPEDAKPDTAPSGGVVDNPFA